MTKKSKPPRKPSDPFYQREAEKYADPIPSREYILQVLEEFGRPMSNAQLLTALDTQDKAEAIGFRLKAMLRDGQLMQDRRGRFCLFNKLTLKRGTVQGHPDGFGFLVVDNEDDDMIISAKEMRTVMHGDIVLAFQSGMDRRGRREAKIHEVIEHANVSVVGRFFSEHGIHYVMPDSKRLTHDISIPMDKTNNAKPGQVVLVEMIAYPNKRSQAVGQVIHILGDHMAPGLEIDVAILAHKLPATWSDDILDAVVKIPQHLREEDYQNRLDQRHLPFVTIDGADAKDFDDAVYCVTKPNGAFELVVAIADVSHYVRPNDKLDQDAANRGTSVYFPGKVVPMLPEALSNGICSLNPHVDRLCMMINMSISAKGKITKSTLYRGIIHSHARLTYNTVHAWLERGGADEGQEALFPLVKNLQALYHLLATTRKARGAIDFDSTETQIVFNENRKIERIVPVLRNQAHRIIEECMLAANVAVARFLQQAEIPMLYRVHAAPDEEKINALRQFLGEMGLFLSGKNKPTPKDLQKTLETLENRPEKHLVQTIMLRSLKQAQYTEINDGHFGLAYPVYTHFTSPIRRYPDLLTHRAIGHILDNKGIKTFPYTLQEMNRLGKHCSATERRADEATREVIAWLKCEYMQDKLGQTFQGTISSVTNFGIFVELDDVYVEGLVHVTSLKNDYYTFEPIKHRLTGGRTHQSYCLGDKITVLVARVDLNERKIDFEPITPDAHD